MRCQASGEGVLEEHETFAKTKRHPHLVFTELAGSQWIAWEARFVINVPAGLRATKGSSAAGAGTKRSNGTMGAKSGAPWATGPAEDEKEVRSRAMLEAIAAPA